MHHTPVRAFRTRDKVVIGLNFGQESDWAKNIEAAQRCRLRLGDQVMELAEPRIVPIEEGVKGMPKVFGFGLGAWSARVTASNCRSLAVFRLRPATAEPPTDACQLGCARNGLERMNAAPTAV